MPQPGTRIGGYDILALIGAGGMGEVYRARDARLGRDVALKVLGPAIAADTQALMRFEREARLLASLNHPNIASIYGVEDGAGQPTLVLELVEGDTLADRLRQGPIPVHEALAIARQIADALDAAHERGIIHRDLKPANIKVTPDGVVKVLDFGLAKALSPDAESDAARDLASSPTVTVGGTKDGVILGTAAYMSPEQARGKALDKRTDIWAFGCVLFEMLTGRRAFGGETASDVIAAILERTPEWTALPAATPAEVCRLVKRCLEKDPKVRLRDIADARVEHEHTGPAAIHPAEPVRRRGTELAWAVGVLLLIGLTATTMWRLRTPDLPAPLVTKTTIALPADQALASSDSAYPLALSRDGARMAFVAEQDGQTQLYVRELNELEPALLPGTAGATHPFFSPDGQWVGFFAGGALQKVAVAGGAPLRICNVSARSVGATWAPDNTIVMALREGGLAIVDAAGGASRAIPGSDPAAWPEILPDGRTVLFATGVGANFSAIATLSLDGGDKHIVARTNESTLPGPALLGTGVIAQPRFMAPAYLVYGQSPGVVRAAPFDLRSRTLTGSATSMVDSVERGRSGGAVYFAVSATGTLLYGPTGDRHQLVWVDRNGTTTPISPDRLAFRHPRLSPDGRLIAVAINDETRRSDVWIYDGARGTKKRLTTEGHNLRPVWTPDGSRITINGAGLFELSIDGSGTRQVLLPPGRGGYPSSWSADGQTLLFFADDAASTHSWVLPRGDTPRLLFARPFSDRQAQFSPDGRWVAYVSSETGRNEVYVEAYPDLGSTVAISAEGGDEPRWSRSGRELFFRQGDAVMVAAVHTSRVFRAETPLRLFAGPYSGAGRETGFDVTPDGQRFVMVKSDETSMLRHIVVVQNWREELRRRVPMLQRTK